MTRRVFKVERVGPVPTDRLGRARAIESAVRQLRRWADDDLALATVLVIVAGELAASDAVDVRDAAALLGGLTGTLHRGATRRLQARRLLVRGKTLEPPHRA